MENDEPLPNRAVSRVKKVLDREKESLSQEVDSDKDRLFSLKKHPATLPEFAPPPMASSDRQLSGKKKGGSSLKAALALSQNQNYPLALIEKLEALQSKSVKKLELKEKLIAARRLKTLGNEIQQWMFAQIAWKARQIKEQEAVKMDYPQREEERQFEITRIIPFLSNR